MAKTEQFLFRMTPELKARLQKAAADDGRSAASYVEQLIIADLDRKDENMSKRTLSNEEIRAAATIFAACYKATGSQNEADITNAQMYPLRGTTLYVQKLHAMHKETPELARLIAEEYDRIDLDAMTDCFDTCMTLQQQGVWMLAYSKYLLQLE